MLEAFFEEADTNKDGLVSKEEFSECHGMMSTHGADLANPLLTLDFPRSNPTSRAVHFVGAQEEAVRQVYDDIDTDKDGRLTAEELRHAAAALGFKLSGENIRSVLQRADEDSDGVISFAELRSFLLLLPKINPQAVFEAFGAELVVEHAIGEATPPIELLHRGIGAERVQVLTMLASKLYSGSVAGAVSRTLTAPIDRLKMVMQFGGGGGGGGGGLLGAARRIHAEGGMRAFFRGNGVNVLKIAPETSIKFLAFDAFKARVAADPSNVSVSERFAAGGGAGAVAQTCVYPLEIAKTRLAGTGGFGHAVLATPLACFCRCCCRCFCRCCCRWPRGNPTGGIVPLSPAQSLRPAPTEG